MVENIAWVLDLGERWEEAVVRRGEGGEERVKRNARVMMPEAQRTVECRWCSVLLSR